MDFSFLSLGVGVNRTPQEIMTESWKEQNNASSHHEEPGCYHIFIGDGFRSSNRFGLFLCFVFSFLFIVTSNICLIHGLRRTTRLTLVTKLFMFMSASDLVTGLVTVPIQILSLTLASESPCWLVGVQAFFNAFTPLLSMFTLMTLSILRCFSVQKPLRRIDEREIYVVLLVQIFISLSLTTWYVFMSQESRTSRELGVFLLVVTAFCALVISASVLINVALHFNLLKKNKQPVRKDSTVKRNKQKDAIYTLLLLSIILVFCYVPNGVAFAIIGYNLILDDDRVTTYRDYVPWAHVPMILNAGINSFVYIIRNRRIKSYYQAVIFCNPSKKKEVYYMRRFSDAVSENSKRYYK